MESLWLSSKDFSPVHTLECGQCFRWEKINGSYLGVVEKGVLEIKPEEDGHLITCVIGDLSQLDIIRYFDAKTNYNEIYAYLREKDHILKEAVDLALGLRVLKQAPFETLITFIISSNNNIPKIKMAVRALSEQFGDYIGTYQNKEFYAFPSINKLAGQSLESLKVKGMGYRNLSIYRTVEKIVSEEIDLTRCESMDMLNCMSWLKQFYGVGDKVASCVALFAYGKADAFPIDTWVKKMLTSLYGIEENLKSYQSFVEDYFPKYAGYAQQILFYYIRNLNKKQITSTQ